jgi:NADH-quinone oxidoreductase subunit J
VNVTFTIAAAVAIVSTLLAITRTNAIHALLYVVTSFFAVAVTFFILGASFVAALEVIVYAGAIMVLFVFVVMLLNLGAASAQQERQWLKPSAWIGPVILSVIMLVELVYVYLHTTTPPGDPTIVSPKAVSLSLFSTYIVGIELASMLLLAGLVGAFYLGRRIERQPEE